MKIRLVLLVVLLIALFITLHTIWLPFVAKYLIVNDTLVPADLIIVPSGNEENQRVEYAASLYKKGLAKKILFCGQLALQKETGINLARLYAIFLGVKEEDIILEEDSATTIENALFIKPIIEANGYRSVILVTHPLHTRRAKIVFRKYLPANVAILASCDLSSLDIMKWWRNEGLARSVAYEYFSFIWYALFRK